MSKTKLVLKWALRFFLVLLWLTGSVFMGGAVLSIKEAMGINIFSATGYHAFESCLKSEYQKAVAGKQAP